MCHRLVENGKKCGKICLFLAFRRMTHESPFLNFYSRKSMKNYIIYQKIGKGFRESIDLPPKMEDKNWPKIPIFSKNIGKNSYSRKKNFSKIFGLKILLFFEIRIGNSG